jgi:hypothetical protein
VVGVEPAVGVLVGWQLTVGVGVLVGGVGGSVGSGLSVELVVGSGAVVSNGAGVIVTQSEIGPVPPVGLPPWWWWW